MLDSMPEDQLRDYLSPLRGKDLACFCGLDQACHADVLIERIKAWEEMGLFDHTLKEVQEINAKRSLGLLKKAFDVNKQPKQTTLDSAMVGM